MATLRAFFPHRERGVRDVPGAEEPVHGRRREGAGVGADCRWGAEGDMSAAIICSAGFFFGHIYSGLPDGASYTKEVEE